MAKKKEATAKKPSLKERMAAGEADGAAINVDEIEDAGEENEEDPAGPQDGDDTDPDLNAEIDGAEEDEQPDPVDANVAIGAFLFSDPNVKRTADMKFDEDGQWIPDLLDDNIENPKIQPEDDNTDQFDGMDELTVAKLTALKEKFGAKNFRRGPVRKGYPETFYMIDATGNDIENAGGTLEDLAFYALTFEPGRTEAAVQRRPDRQPDPILQTHKRQPINSLHDMQIVLRDTGHSMRFEKVGDFYEINVFGENDHHTAIVKGTVPINATKEDLTGFYYKAKKFF